MFARGVLATLTVVMLGLFAGIAALNLRFEARRELPVGERLQTWARRFPYSAAALALLFGAMLAHFFWPL